MAQGKRLSDQVAELEALAASLAADKAALTQENAALTQQLAQCQDALDDCMNPDVDCVLGPEISDGIVWSGVCVNGIEEGVETWHKDVVTPPSGDGAACGPKSGTRTVTRPCVVAPPADPPVLQVEPMGTLCIKDWHDNSGSYMRQDRLRVLRSTAEKIEFISYNSAALVPAGTYRVLVKGQVVGTATLAAPVSTGAVIVDATQIVARGFQHVRIEGPLPITPFPMFIGDGPNDTILMQSTSQDIHEGGPFGSCVMPASLDPPIVPLAERECPAFTTAIPKEQLYRTTMVPQRDGTVLRPCVTKEGHVSFANMHAYRYEHLKERVTPLAMLDGPRGRGTLNMATSLLVDRKGGVYFSDGHRTGRLHNDGEVITRCGYRHKGMPGQWEQSTTHVANYNKAVANKQWETAADILEEWLHDANVELVGDWSAVPRYYRGFWLIWGIDWVKSTIGTDPSLPQIGGEDQHPVPGPQLLVASSMNGAIYREDFGTGEASLTTPPKVKLLTAELQHCFAVQEYNGIAYVTLRDADKIIMLDAATGADKGVLVSTPCPEGLRIKDGILTHSTRVRGTANASIRQWDLQAGGYTPRSIPVQFNAIGGQFISLDVAGQDDGFGEPGTVFYCTWTNVNTGYPKAVLPNGQEWGYATHGAFAGGKGGRWWASGYNCAVGVGLRRLYFSMSDEGLWRISKALASDPTLDEAKFDAGRKEYVKAGDAIIHGQNTWGFQRWALPFGQSANKDYYMQHAKL